MYVALTNIIFIEMELDEVDRARLQVVLNTVGYESYTESVKNKEIILLKQKFTEKLDEIATRGPTAKLWIQYWQMIMLIKNFIAAERSGN